MAGTSTRIALDAPLRGIRVRSRAEAAPGAARVRWLVQLGETRARREAEALALQATAQAVQRSLQALSAAVGARLDELSRSVVEFGLLVAREIVGDALARGAVDPTDTVARCLRDCVHGADEADLALHLHPDDLGPVRSALAAMPDLQRQVAQSRLLPDPSLPRGAVRAETATGRLRYDPREVFERLAEAVRTAALRGGP